MCVYIYIYIIYNYDHRLYTLWTSTVSNIIWPQDVTSHDMDRETTCYNVAQLGSSWNTC